jgi:hypothetical protein
LEILPFSLYVPNAFTPLRGYGEETVFLPKGRSLVEYHVWVYDTWGNLLWDSEAINPEDGSPADFWDGTVDGVLLPQDVYVWKIEAEFAGGFKWEKDYGKGQTRITGTVTLIK